MKFSAAFILLVSVTHSARPFTDIPDVQKLIYSAFAHSQSDLDAQMKKVALDLKSKEYGVSTLNRLYNTVAERFLMQDESEMDRSASIVGRFLTETRAFLNVEKVILDWILIEAPLPKKELAVLKTVQTDYHKFLALKDLMNKMDSKAITEDPQKTLDTLMSVFNMPLASMISIVDAQQHNANDWAVISRMAKEEWMRNKQL